jgi:hypothetical protein
MEDLDCQLMSKTKKNLDENQSLDFHPDLDSFEVWFPGRSYGQEKMALKGGVQ